MNKHALQEWDDLLAKTILDLDELHVRVAGKPHVATVELVAFLKMNNALVKQRVESAIVELAETKHPPAWLSADEIVNLTHRVNVGRGTIQRILSRQIVLPMPASTNAKRFLRWLLIDLWDVSGGAYI